VARHTKGNNDGVKAGRLQIREIPKSKFTVYGSVEALYSVLLMVEFKYKAVEYWEINAKTDA
jgi:hypothetical protein